MKNDTRIRILGLLLCTLAALACVPTPEQEFVVNKADNGIEVKLSAEAEPEKAEAAPLFPDAWKEAAYRPNERTTVEIDADIVQRADGVYPVWRTRAQDFSDEDAAELVTKMLPKPASVRTSELTKEDWTREFRTWLDEVEAQRAWIAAGKPNDGVDRDESPVTDEEVEESSKWFMQQIADAPDTLPETPVSDYRGIGAGDSKVFTLSDGRTAYVGAETWELIVCLGCTTRGYVYPYDLYRREKQHDGPSVEAWRETRQTREEAETMLVETLDRLGMSDFAVASAQKATLCQELGGKAVPVTAGWVFRLGRSFGGYPLSGVPFEPAQNLSYGADDGFTANRPIMEEQLEIMIDPDGLAAFTYQEAKTIVGVESANVELLLWDEARTRIQNAINVTVPIAYLDEHDFTALYRVYRLLLTTYTVRVKNSDEYYEMPCWVVFFDWDIRNRGVDPAYYEENRGEAYWLANRGDTQLTHNALIVNAVDGSIVYTNYGA